MTEKDNLSPAPNAHFDLVSYYTNIENNITVTCLSNEYYYHDDSECCVRPDPTSQQLYQRRFSVTFHQRFKKILNNKNLEDK